MILWHSVQSSQIAQPIPSEAEAAGRIAHNRRWLSNQFVNVPVFYRPLIRQVLMNWTSRAVFILLDTTSMNHGKLQGAALVAAHGLWALPLAWRVWNGPGLVGVWYWCLCVADNGDDIQSFINTSMAFHSVGKHKKRRHETEWAFHVRQYDDLNIQLLSTQRSSTRRMINGFTSNTIKLPEVVIDVRGAG
ncbi:MAG TPA: hypothetical protein VJG32_15330 [Anaerolineae bacterium]|nr:hypothetical protein [Anaerolineae bacterium]